ncbi:MAG: DegT/DnrJ/EryC1/StrS family aminotransferase [Planctomycetota bacterium]|jgi:dTDP-4-amino-4,6-dideoxygalactose transaminase
MTVPMFELKTQHSRIRAELDAALARVMDSGQFILGPEVEAFERELAAAARVPHAIGLTSGTDALLVSLQALGIGPGQDAEVLTSPFTFFATGSTIARVGAKPAFVDIEPVGFMMDPEAIDAATSRKVRALLPVHLFGQCAEMDVVNEAARKVDACVLEDACQAVGADYKGGAVGTLGELAALSFFPTKNLGGLGDGGAVLTTDGELAAKVRTLRVHGQGSATYLHEEIGINGRLDALQAAALRVKLKYLAKWNDARRANADRYRDMFIDAKLHETVTIPEELPGRRHVFHQYVVRAPRHDELLRHLKSKGVGCAVYYPLPLHLQPCFKYLGYKEGAFPAAELASKEVLALPIFPELTEAQQAEVVAGIREFYDGAGG